MGELRGISSEDAPEFVRERLEAWYRTLYPDRRGIAVSHVGEITRGWETRLFHYTLSYKSDCSPHEDPLVARVFFGKGARSEYETMRRLMNVGYPVPRVYHFDEGDVLGQPFLTMEFIAGRSMEEEFLSGSKEDLEWVLELMMGLFVRLHDLEPSEIFPGRPGVSSVEYIEGVLRRHRQATAEYGIEWLDPLIDWLEEGKGSVTPMPPAVLHGDFHPMNIMLRADGCPVVLDWGASHIGDRRSDLSWLMLLAGAFLDSSFRDAILAAYEAASGVEIEDIRYFEALSILRRLTDIAVSMTAGADNMGMRPGAVEMMREVSGHLRKIYDALVELTGLRLPGYEEFLNTM